MPLDRIGATHMEWQDIIVTPLFWIVSTIGTIAISIVSNLLTPFVSAFFTRHLHARRTGLREKQKKRRNQVITLEENIHRRTSTKLDAVFKLLYAMVFILGCLFLFQVTFGALHSSSITGPSPKFEIPTFIIILLALLFATVVFRLGLDDMSLAVTADRRERARHDFLAQHGPASIDAIKQFEDEWDLKAFGVNSQNDPSQPSNNRT
jgi:hypothetical protein